MNQIVRSIDFELGPGNPGAVAVFLHGAQGSTVQDVTVRMTDALAGFGGGGGAAECTFFAGCSANRGKSTIA